MACSLHQKLTIPFPMGIIFLNKSKSAQLFQVSKTKFPANKQNKNSVWSRSLGSHFRKKKRQEKYENFPRKLEKETSTNIWIYKQTIKRKKSKYIYNWQAENISSDRCDHINILLYNRKDNIYIYIFFLSYYNLFLRKIIL